MSNAAEREELANVEANFDEDKEAETHRMVAQFAAQEEEAKRKLQKRMRELH